MLLATGEGDARIDPNDEIAGVAMKKKTVAPIIVRNPFPSLHRRLLLTAAALSPLPLWSQQKRIPRVVLVTYDPASEDRKKWYRKEFAEYGLVDGRNVELSWVDIHPRAPVEVIEARAKEVVASRPDLIGMLFSDVLFTFQRLTRDIPIVFNNFAFDPVAVGLVESNRRPGGNITGTSHGDEEMIPKGWSLLKELVPLMRRGGHLYVQEEIRSRYWPLRRAAMAAAALRLGIEIPEIGLPFGTPDKEVIAAIRAARVDALGLGVWGTPGIIDFLRLEKIPTMAGPKEVEKGLLVGIAPDMEETWKQARVMIAKILGGESPATIPIYKASQATRLFINMRAAREMRLKVPEWMVVQAYRVFE